jgi:Holliday junction resolvase RusA-like endonuclease
MRLAFFVPGKPATAGSKRSFVAKTGRVVTKDDCAGGPAWRAIVRATAREAFVREFPKLSGTLLDAPLSVFMAFTFPRPRGHSGTGRNAGRLKSGAPEHHTQRPDVVKLARAVEDALTGVVWRDDALIHSESIKKVWGDTYGATVVVEW